MTITKNHNGSLTISDIVDGYRVQETYFGYTKREAMRIFKDKHEERHEYIDASDDSGFVTCNKKGKII